MRGDRQKAAREFVRAASAALEAGETLFDTVFDWCVVAGLEVQAVETPAPAPVAPVECMPATQVDGCADDFATTPRQYQHQCLGQAAPEYLKELARKVDHAAVALYISGVELMEHIPQFRGHVRADAHFHMNAGFLHMAAFALQFLALVGAEAGEKIIEAGLITVVPVKLETSAVQVSLLFECGGVGGIAKQDRKSVG